ncbi:HNH endonuclease [Liquorilactobacillus vini]|uniref:HNH endonuclease n=1 Tax=Liquorilactobacillus vini TaxID=238015 RepID=UPI000554D5EA|nr:HNH endonuclease [Liquorilactobacillus vini]
MRVRRCRYTGCHAMAEFPNHYCKQHMEHEAEYIASRQKWSNQHNKQRQHRYNTVTRNRNDTKREQYNFYRTRQWAHLRQQVLDRDHYICQYCGAINSKTVDHIVPIEADSKRKADINNLATICRRCHYTKTQWEQSYYGTGRGNILTGAEPVVDIHKIVFLMNKNQKNE